MDDYLGMVRMFAGNFAPRTFMGCNGQLLAISSNTALFSILGTSFGGNGTTNFQLPNMQGRKAIGAGSSPFGSYVLGEVSGNTSLSILINNLPAHTHVGTLSGSGGSVTIPAPVIKASSAVATDAAPSASVNTLAQLVTPRVTGSGLYNNTTPDITMNTGATSSTAPVTISGTVTNGLTGSNIPVDISNPYVALTFVIVTQGIFPTRN